MKFAMFMFCVLFLMAPSARLMADEEAAPMDYAKQTKDHRFIFVMLAPKGWGSGQSDLHHKYRKSGLYPIHGPAKPLWTVNWYSFDVIPSSDGHHLVRLELSNRDIPFDLPIQPVKTAPWPEDFSKVLALAFYEDGREIKHYLVGSLVKKPKDAPFLRLPFSTSHMYWRKASHFDDNRSMLSVTTYGGYHYQTGQTYMFDVKTGLRIAHPPPPAKLSSGAHK